MEDFWIGAFFGAFVLGIIAGSFCHFIAMEKGRNGITWFVLGFLFNLYALIAIAGVGSVSHRGKIVDCDEYYEDLDDQDYEDDPPPRSLGQILFGRE